MSVSDRTKRRVMRVMRAYTAQAQHSHPSKPATLSHGAIQRAMTSPQSLPSNDVLHLQRLLGNNQMSQLLQGGKGGARSSMTVGASHDRFEHEADSVAAQVTDGGTVQRSPEVGSEGGTVSNDLANRIQRAKGGGSPAPERVRRAVEAQTGSDFRNVRVHNNREANAISAELGAKAATHGNHIFLARDQSPNDTRLMAHELTHTIQQGANGQTANGVPSIQREDEDEKKIKKLNKKISGSKAKRGLAKVGKGLLTGLDWLTTAPLRLIDQASVLDLHMKDFGNFVKTGKTRKQRAGKDVATPKYKQGDKRRQAGRSGLRALLSGVNIHTRDLNPFLPWHGVLNPFLAMGRGQRVTDNLAKGEDKNIEKLRGQKQNIRSNMAQQLVGDDQTGNNEEEISNDLVSTLVEEEDLSN